MTYVISDIHGRADRFHNILDQIHFSKEDTLYILGDVIDRNPDGIQILLEVMDSPNIKMLLGNHEYMMMNVVHCPSANDEVRNMNLSLWFYNGGEITLHAFQRLPEAEKMRIIDYVEALPLNMELSVNGKDYLLVHGSPESSYLPDNPDYQDAKTYAVWNRMDPFQENGFLGITVLCGHTPTIFFQHKRPMEVFVNGNVICLDCGCAFTEGRLACLCLETGEILYSTDGPSLRRWLGKRRSLY